MPITSLAFAGFVVIVLVLYNFLPKRRWQNYLLLLASYYLCIRWAWQFAIVLLGFSILNYWLAQRISQSQKHARKWLWSGIAANTLAWFFFKYMNFFVSDALTLLKEIGISTHSGTIGVLLPIGISYYVLEVISYLVDVFRRQIHASDDFVVFALYLAYFPKLVAGPIERARTFLPKLQQPQIVSHDLIAKSLALIVVGLVRKIIVADILFSNVNPRAFQSPLVEDAPSLLANLFSYFFALYNDFAGYTNIMRGVSGLFGIRLSQNFSRPFFSHNFSEFWKRWHMTLTNWFRDYIYFPLGRLLVQRVPKRANLINLMIPALVTMLASGLWHGNSVNMFVWGGLTGAIMAIEGALSYRRKHLPLGKRPRWKQVIVMMSFPLLLVVIAIPFRMSLPVAIEYWRILLDPSRYHITFPFAKLLLLLIGVVLVLWFEFLQAYHKDELFFLQWHYAIQGGALALALLAIFLVSQSVTTEPFVYQGF
jgi:alginate O-acetyltransferase complex protein AlgI